MKSLVESHFKMKGITPISFRARRRVGVESHFKMKGITPYEEYRCRPQW